MKRMSRTWKWTTFATRLGALWLLAMMMLIGACAKTTPSTATNTQPATTDDGRAAQQIVAQARMTLDNFLNDKQIGDSTRSFLKRAKAVAIFPQVLEGAFLVGAAGGNGVVLARKNQNQWSNPAFYTMGEVSFGFQAGGQASEVLLFALTDRGLAALQSHSVKLGGDVGVAAGPVGLGAAAATENLSADIISYVRNKGLYAGVAVAGAVLAVRDSLNQAYYGRPVTPSDILVKDGVSNPQAAPLVGELRRIASLK